MNISDKFLTHNRPYTKRKKTTAVAVHWVANPGSSASATRNYFQNTDRSVSSNYVVGLNGEIICCIPDEEVSWCTNQANSYTVSIETCHPDWTGKFNENTYKSLVELTAHLCRKYNLNPLSGGVIRHFDVTGKNCPKCFVKQKNGGSDDNSNSAWNKFKSDVADAMGVSDNHDSFNPYCVKVISSDGFINIRKTPNWNDNDIVGKIKTGNTKYTIVAETMLGGTKFGKLKSGAGWISLNEKYVKKL